LASLHGGIDTRARWQAPYFRATIRVHYRWRRAPDSSSGRCWL